MNLKSIIPWVITIVCVGLLLSSVFRQCQKVGTDPNVERLIKHMDDDLKEEQELRKSETARAEGYLQESKYKDSLLQLKSKTNTIRYERVPVIVNSLNQPELVSAIESEFGN